MIYSLHKALMFNVHPSVNSLIRAILGIWLILICEVPAHLSPHPDIGHFSRDLTGWEGDREMKDPLIAPKEKNITGTWNPLRLPYMLFIPDK